MGWTATTHLVVVYEDGTVNVYDVHGTFVATFSAAPDAMAQGVLDARVWGGGVVVLTHGLQLYACTFRDETFGSVRPKKLCDPELSGKPPSWVVIPPEATLSRTVEVLLATPEGSVVTVDGNTAQDQLVTEGPFVAMALSPNGTILAMFNTVGELLVVSVDFARNLSEFSTRRSEPPEALVWCGNDSVVMYWSAFLLMAGPFGDYIEYFEDSPAALVTETDGLRILTTEACQLLRRVPDCVQHVFGVGSTEPPALLYDALEHYQRNSPKAYESITSVRSSLVEAVEACVEAAGHMLDARHQRKLLQAASFGKCFLEMYQPDAFVDMAKTLRVLNAVRFYEVGIPLTFAQYTELTPQVLVNRLINQHHHLLAYRICEHMELPKDRVLIHWACAKVVKGDSSDADLCAGIVNKLGAVKGISYVEIAETAFRRGRVDLATALLEYEPRPAEQVPLLITMKEDELALVKAIDSGNTDLVYLVLLELKENRPLEYLFRVIANKPVAADLLATYCKSQDREMLKDFFYSADQRHESANIMVREAYAAPDLGDRERKLRQAINFYADSREAAFEAGITKDQLTLLSFQAEAERRAPGEAFVDLSLSSTIHKLVLLGMLKDAAKLKALFKVPNKRYAWLMVRGLSESSNWPELEKFAKSSRKSPIGWAPFARACINFGAPRESVKYIQKVTPLSDRAVLFVEVGDLEAAAEAAAEAKDVDLLQGLLAQAGGRGDLAPRIRMYLEKLT